jgi:hypothetical protein
MTDLTPIECEARIVGLSKQRRKDGDWVEVKFHIHPDDHPAALFILPLGTQCMLGVKGLSEKPTADSEAATETTRPKGGERARLAGILCGDPAFQNWFHESGEADWAPHCDRREYTARSLRVECGIDSRAELDHNKAAAGTFDQIVDLFRKAQRGQTTEAYETMARDRR